MALFLLQHVQLFLEAFLFILKHALLELVNFFLLILIDIVEFGLL